MLKTLLLPLLLIISFQLNAQVTDDNIIGVDYRNPRKFEIAGITVSGVQYLENNELVIMLSGLTIGQKINIPGDEISSAIDKLYKQGMFEQVAISVTAVQGDFVYLDIFLTERPKLSKFSFTGIKRNEANNLREKLNLVSGDIITENSLLNAKRIIRNYFVDKGFYFCNVDITQKADTTKANSIILNFIINKGNRIKIDKIEIAGNNGLEDKRIKRSMKNTKLKRFYNVLKASKFIPGSFTEDKNSIITRYNEFGYRDAQIVSDSIVPSGKKCVSLYLSVEEGPRYYFRNITWVGNTKYSSDTLSQILRIKKGDVYNQQILESNLYMNAESRDVTSLYMDDGYLFFSVTPVEAKVENDSIDLEIQIYEGKQAIINKVYVTGNTRTNDKVILREIRTRPGQLFSRSDIIRTHRELAQMRYFNSETIQVNPKPNPSDGTVDIEYVVEETSTDQFELSGGWGLGRLVGTLGLSFNNFSINNIFKKGTWRPLPTGDGQKFSIRAQSNGVYYQSYNASFTEPWLGGKKPNAFSLTVFHSMQTNGVTKKLDGTYSESGALLSREEIKISGISAGLGKRMKWPDDYFIGYLSLNFQHYELDDYYSSYTFNTGTSNNFNVGLSISRASTDAPIYPRSGSDIMFSVNLTPPYSLFSSKDYSTISADEKYQWLEYHKIKITTSFFTKLAGNLVLNTRVKYGFLGLYNKDIGLSPFERFYLGGDGLSGFALDGREIIGMRGYSNLTLTSRNTEGDYIGGAIFGKYTFELRYPLSLNPMATIYMLGFMEAGNTWLNFKEFKPFNVMRSAGVGVRIYLPMFGLLGLDYGYGFDDVPGLPSANKGQFHFSINQSID